jgi:hypothetical protein
MNKNREKLLSFIEYCLEHPEERFWQALRNWAKVDFIFTHKGSLDDILVGELRDTFYDE